jgi:hypothetical protein
MTQSLLLKMVVLSLLLLGSGCASTCIIRQSVAVPKRRSSLKH